MVARQRVRRTARCRTITTPLAAPPIISKRVREQRCPDQLLASPGGAAYLDGWQPSRMDALSRNCSNDSESLGIEHPEPGQRPDSMTGPPVGNRFLYIS